MVSVVAVLRWQIKCDIDAREAVIQHVTEAAIRLFSGPEARVLAHRPQPAAIHGRIDSACEWKLAGGPDIALIIEADASEVIGSIEAISGSIEAISGGVFRFFVRGVRWVTQVTVLFLVQHRHRDLFGSTAPVISIRDQSSASGFPSRSSARSILISTANPFFSGSRSFSGWIRRF